MATNTRGYPTLDNISPKLAKDIDRELTRAKRHGEKFSISMKHTRSFLKS